MTKMEHMSIALDTRRVNSFKVNSDYLAAKQFFHNYNDVPYYSKIGETKIIEKLLAQAFAMEKRTLAKFKVYEPSV